MANPVDAILSAMQGIQRERNREMDEALSQVVKCPGCGQKNRVSLMRALSQKPRCGKCKLPIVLSAEKEAGR